MERQAWREELARLEERLQANLELTAQSQQLEGMCERMDRGVDHLSFEEKCGLLQAFGLKVRVREDHSYEWFGALPAICQIFPTSGSWKG